MTLVRYQEVRITGTYRWKDDGKWRQQQRSFGQTLNPFNRNAAGAPKSLQEIMAEIEAERAAWAGETCRRCTECDGSRHHWLPNEACEDIGDPAHLCKHCDAVGDDCDECGGEGCRRCTNEGVIFLRLAKPGEFDDAEAEW